MHYALFPAPDLRISLGAEVRNQFSFVSLLDWTSAVCEESPAVTTVEPNMNHPGGCAIPNIRSVLKSMEGEAYDA